MSAEAGRQITFLWNSAEVLGVREKGLTLNGAPIDITSDEDAGVRTLLADISAVDQVDIDLAGVTKSRVLMIDWFAKTRTRTASLTYTNGDMISGLFFLASLSEKDPYNDAVTFDAKLQSTGVITFTPYS